MKKWRIMRVNKEEIIENMIQYIEEEERNLQAARMSNDSKAAKTDIVSTNLPIHHAIYSNF